MENTQSQLLSIDQIRKSHGPQFKDMPVPEWGEGSVRAKRLGAPDFLEIQGLPHETQEEQFEMLVRVVQKSLIDEHGAALFKDEDLHVLRDSPTIVTRIGNEILDFNRLVGRDSKNSPSTP